MLCRDVPLIAFTTATWNVEQRGVDQVRGMTEMTDVEADGDKLRPLDVAVLLAIAQGKQQGCPEIPVTVS